MSAHGARRLMEMARNLAQIIGIELVVAAQGVDLRKQRRRPRAVEEGRPAAGARDEPGARAGHGCNTARASPSSTTIACWRATCARRPISLRPAPITSAAGHALLPGLGEVSR